MKLKTRFRVLRIENGMMRVTPICDETLIPIPDGADRSHCYITEIDTNKLQRQDYWDETHRTKRGK